MPVENRLKSEIKPAVALSPLVFSPGWADRLPIQISRFLCVLRSCSATSAVEVFFCLPVFLCNAKGPLRSCFFSQIWHAICKLMNWGHVLPGPLVFLRFLRVSAVKPVLDCPRLQNSLADELKINPVWHMALYCPISHVFPAGFSNIAKFPDQDSACVEKAGDVAILWAGLCGQRGLH